VSDDKEKAEEFEIIEQTGDGTELKDQPEPKVEDERLRNDDDDDEDEGSSGHSDETPEQRAERRREERRKRRERQKRAEAENKAELQRLREANDFMASKMQQMEALHLRNEARQVDERMSNARAIYERAERAHEAAIASGDGAAATRALRIRDQAGADYREAEALRERLMYVGQAPTQRQQPQQPRGPDPRVVQKAKSFVEKHSWIDPSGLRDEDSAVARALDMKLQADGYDPSTDEYWDRLESTLEKRLPHRFAKGGRSAPPVTGGMDRAGSGKKTFVVSPERKKAMIEAGAWDDPVARNRMIKRYMEYDAQQKSNAAR